ncbi:MAG: IS4 family transposase, partial [Clostridia bacterium]|nr:IS4 family transposase [Clostridia bacterium]
ELTSGGHRPLKMNFEEQLRILIYYHLQEHSSAQHLLQSLKEDDFARQHIAPEQGIEKSSFSEAINNRGLEKLLQVFTQLQKKAAYLLPDAHPELGSLVGIDGSLIDGTLSMLWADYRKGSKKAKVHVGFDLNHSIPRKVYLTEGNGAERPFVSQILSKDETSVTDRGYQCHALFDRWQKDGQLFICRIKAGTKKKVLSQNPVPADSIVFFDATVLLGTDGVNQSRTPLRLVGYEVDRVKYWIATNRCDLTGEQIAQAYKLRWNIENFFAWWKRHLKVYHLIARSAYGLMVQILAGLITYLLLAIYCHQNFQEKVSIRRVRQLRISIENELRWLPDVCPDPKYEKDQELRIVDAKT